jgi:NTE family protein
VSIFFRNGNGINQKDIILFKRPKIGLALGAGGARGLAHIGVLKIFEQEKIPIDFIAGTSIGALIGAMYALNPDAEAVEKKMFDYINSPGYKIAHLERFTKGKAADGLFAHLVTFLTERIVINLAPSRISLVSNKKLEQALLCMVNETDIKKTKIPFSAVASDLVSGREVVLNSGNIITAIISSGSIPGFLPPVSMSDYLLLDGSVVQTVPVEVVSEMGADVVFAVDVSQNLEKISEYDNILDVMNRSNQMTSKALTELQLRGADIILKPKVGQYHWSEFDFINILINEGARVAKELLPEIKKKLNRKFFLN